MIVKNIVMYLVVVNLLAFACFGIDKQKAKMHQWRISEKALLGIAICGGSWALSAACGFFIIKQSTPNFLGGCR